jgi:hypothetical protein
MCLAQRVEIYIMVTVHILNDSYSGNALARAYRRVSWRIALIRLPILQTM